MKARVRFHLAARLEAEAAARWYEERQPGLGDDFFVTVEDTIHAIADARNPGTVSPDDPRARRVRLYRFPYFIVFMLRSASEIVIVAVAHAKRRPGYWRERLRSGKT
ncbi:type II toxin-antitoxin system RelE/ParE family toxin [Pendulispora albinea]|uniref:Type II toxin-antitoxin system RelE/ParE family toxin n=1 Tax=Pendulispora albinea TaxID=2741071 RepID=A0ABZ2MCB4_9BACT